MNAMDQQRRWPLTGRDDELRAFRDALGDRQRRSFLLSGPAGVGKSRLAEECWSLARAEGWPAKRALATDAAALVPLGAIAHLLPVGIDSATPSAGLDAVARALAPGGRPSVVLIDDLHLLDATSARMLHGLRSDGAIRLVATIRDGAPVAPAVQDLVDDRDALRLELEDLTEDQVQALLPRVLRGLVGTRTVRELHSASRGNALYLRELVLGAIFTDALRYDGEVWELHTDELAGTPRLHEMIECRLSAVPPDAQEMLDTLALCEPLPEGVLERTGAPGALDALRRADLVHVDRQDEDGLVSLAHPLYGEVLRARLTPLRRRVVLRRQIEHARTHDTRRNAPLRIASWQLTADGTADPDLLVRAAGLARHSHDHRQVVALLESLPEDRHTSATRLLLGDALWELGRARAAEEALDAAYTLARTEEELTRATLARAWNRFSADRGQEALDLLDRFRAEDRSARTTHVLRISEGVIRAFTGEPERALELLGSLEEDPDTAADVMVWAQGALLKGEALAMTGRTRQAITWAEHAHSAQLRTRSEAPLPHPGSQLIVLVMALTEAGELRGAVEEGERAFRMVDDARMPLPRIWAAHHLARALWLAGRPASARHWYAQAVALCRMHHQPQAARLANGGLAACAAVLGDAEGAQAALAAVEPGTALLAGEERLGQAWAEASRGHLREARRILFEAADQARATGHATSESFLLMDAARLGGAGEAVKRLEELAESCDGSLIPARAAFTQALVRKCPEALLAASDGLAEIGAELLAAEAAAAAAEAWRRRGGARRAASAQARSEELAGHCEGARTPMLATPETHQPLTPREREIALLAAGGATSKEVAKLLGLSIRTVNNHLQHLYGKLGVTGREEMVRAFTSGTDGPAVPEG
ncbi:LuxR C-terminal-related transcriptional regulator [Streptomyces sp. NPDC005805]|uniref:helix-turn-helix transcriptional regulator n=1 Tax=Streptomyces sp. NPDC005805 TaxID=3157068 RepID=UPI0033FB6837